MTGARFTIDQLKAMGYDADGNAIPSHPTSHATPENTLPNDGGKGKPNRMGNGGRTKAELFAERYYASLWPKAIIIPQGITLRFQDGTKYTPDLAVYNQFTQPVLIEVKGGYRGPGWEQGMERHRRARDCFSTYFLFTLATVKGGKLTES